MIINKLLEDTKILELTLSSIAITALVLSLFSFVVPTQSAYADYSFPNSPTKASTVSDNSFFPRINATGNNVYLAWLDGDLGDINFTRSTNGGTTFSTPVNLSNDLSVSASPQFAVSGTNVYVVWVDASLGNNRIFFSKSTDGGGTFSAPSALSNAVDSAVKPQIAVSGTKVYVVWQDTTTTLGAKPKIFFVVSTNSGGTFGSTINLSNTSGNSIDPQIIASGSSVYVVWEDLTFGNGDILIQKSNDYGSTFNLGTVTTPGNPLNLSNNTGLSKTPQIALSGGNVYVTWDDFTPGTDTTMVTRSTNGGDSFGIPLSLSSTGPSTLPQIVASGSNVYVVWQDASGTKDIWYSRSTDYGATYNGGTPGPATNISSNSGNSVLPQISVSGNNVHIIWRDDSSGSTKINVYTKASTDNGATFGTLNILSTTGTNPNADSPQIAASGSKVYAVWRDNLCGTGLVACSGNPFNLYVRTGNTTSINIVFDKPQYTIGSTATITITSPSSSTATISPVTIKSSSDSVGISATFSQTSTHVYTGTVTFTSGSTSGSSLHVSAGDTITATFSGQSGTALIFPRVVSFNLAAYFVNSKIVTTVSDQNSNTNPASAETIAVNMTTTSNATGISVNLLETGPNTGVFTNSVNGTFKAHVGDTITASYQGATATALVIGGTSPGGGGGGLIRPGLVLDIIASLSSASHSRGGAEYVPPSLDISSLAASPGALPDNIRAEVLNHDPYKPMSPSSDNSFDFPFSIDGGGYILAGLTNTIQTQTEKTGIPAEVKLKLLSSLSLQHIALYTNLRGNARDLYKSDTYIIYEKGQPLQIVDPHGYFADVKFDLTTTGYKNTVVYTITFAKPMEKSDIDLRVWDDQRSSSDNRILDAWQVEPQSSTASSQTTPATTTPATTTPATTTPATTTPTQNTAPAPENTPDLMPAIKDWGGYSPNPISDSDLLAKIGIQGQHIPSWVMKTSKWIIDGEMSQQEFVNAIKYLSDKGMIK